MRATTLVPLVLLLAACARAPASPVSSATAQPAVATSSSILLHGRPANEDAVIAAALTADIVWLGEKHDDAEHHRLQARVIAALVKAGARPAVVFEMIEDDQQPILDELAKKRSTPDDYRVALDWDKSGWPPFSLYAPIFAVALESNLRIVAGNAPKALVKKVAFTGEGAGDLEPLPGEGEKDLEAELAEAHCGMLPPESLPAMALAQRVRDARLAEHARQNDKTARPRAVVVTGNGHARLDRGAPFAAGTGEPGLRQFAISFHEIGDAATDVPYDAVWKTPAMPPEDHCKDMHVHARSPHEEKK